MSKKITAVVLVIALCLIYGTASSFADGGVKITVAPVNASVGDDVIVKVDVVGGSVGRAEAMLEYNTDMLSYVSGGSSSGDNGTVQLKAAGTGEDLSFSLKYKAVGEGESRLEISSAQVYDLDEQLMDCDTSGADVKITGSGDGSGDGDKSGSGDGSGDDQSGNGSGDGSGDGSDVDDGAAGGFFSNPMHIVIVALICLVLIGLVVYFVVRNKENR